MTMRDKPEGVDWDRKWEVDLPIGLFAQEHEYNGSREDFVVDCVAIGGIPVDDMINWCKANRWDGPLLALEAYKLAS